MEADPAGEDEQSGQAPSRDDSWFAPALVATFLAGLVARLVFVTTVTFPRLANDAVFFRRTAASLAHGRGYAAPFVAQSGRVVATAAHPPLFSGLLSVFDLLGMDSVHAQRVALAVVSAAAVPVMGLLGRRVGGPAVGIVAALIAALDPLWLQPVGTLMSESIYLVAIPSVLLLAVRCLDHPTAGRFGSLGVVIALAVLIRSEAIDLVVLLGVPLLVFVTLPWRQRAVLGLALLIGLLLLVGPWLIRNEVQVGGAVLSDQQGATLAGSYCMTTFDSHDAVFGSFDGQCADGSVGYFVKYVKPPGGATRWTELTLDRALTNSSEQYARHHLGELPGVILARESSTWGLGHHAFQLQLADAGGRNRSFEEAGWILYWTLLPLVIVGGIVLGRRSFPRLVIVVMPIVVVVVTVAVTYGSTRFRVAAEPSLAVLAGVGLVAGVGWIRPSTPRTGCT